MKAFIYGANAKMEVVDRPVPRIAKDEALMKVLVASICGTDLRNYKFGVKNIPENRILGHEACGELVEIGKEVENFKVGDRIIVAPAIGCGSCASCLRGKTNMCDNLKTIGFEYDGTFSEYMKIPSQAFKMGNVLKVKTKIKNEEATLSEPVACCINGQSFLNISPGNSVLIFGAGFIGCMHAELALKSGASFVLLVDISQPRLEIAKRLIPAASIINTTEKDIVQFISEKTKKHGMDVIITANPDGNTHTLAGLLAAKNGRISLFGGISGESTGYLDSNMIHYKELSLFGSHATNPQHVSTVLELLESEVLDLLKYCSGTYPLVDIEKAFERLKKVDIMKLLIKP